MAALRDQEGNTALHLAALGGGGGLRVLVDCCGAQRPRGEKTSGETSTLVRLLGTKNDDGCTPLHCACIRCGVEMLEVLLGGLIANEPAFDKLLHATSDQVRAVTFKIIQLSVY